MKKWFGILMIGLVAVFVFGNLLVAEDRQSAGGVHGTFVRFIEQKVGDQVYMGMVIKPRESDDHVTVLVPRRPENLAEKVRKLRKGQEVEIPYITDGGQKWVKVPESEHRREEPRHEGERRVEVEHRRDEHRREGERREERRVPDRPLPPRGERLEREPSRGLAGQLEQLAGQIRQIAERLRRMENEMRQLRAENERLKRMLRQRDSRGEDRDRRDPEHPRQRDVRRDIDRPRDGDVRRDRPDAEHRRGVRDGDGDGERRVRPPLRRQSTDRN